MKIILLTSFICLYLFSQSAEAFSGKSKDGEAAAKLYPHQQQNQQAYYYQQDQYGNIVYQPMNVPNYYSMNSNMPPSDAQKQANTPVMIMPAPNRGLAGHKPMNPGMHAYHQPMQLRKNYAPIASKGAPTMFDKQKLSKVDAEEALTRLKHGNLRFTQGISHSKKFSQAERIRLMAGQEPHSVILTCSDSRVAPEHVFDQGLGKVFVIRNSGPSLDANTVASLEYAVSTLGARLVLVMGHEGCAGLKAAIMTPEGKSSGSPAWDQVIADIKPRLGNLYRQPASVGLIRESNENTRGIVKDMLSRSHIVRQRVSDGHLQLRSAFYHLDSGLVDFH